MIRSYVQFYAVSDAILFKLYECLPCIYTLLAAGDFKRSRFVCSQGVDF